MLSGNVIYDSPNLRLRHVAANETGPLVVTFACLQSKPSVHLAGFAENVLSAEGYSAIYVSCRSNSWYQYPDMPDALRAARAVAQRYRRVLCYGFSMGAYAAMRFAGAIGATETLALSPQFSPNPASPPFDRRWSGECASFEIIDETMPVPPVGKVWVVYDPKDFDSKHVSLLEKRQAFERIELPFLGHSIATALAEMKLLKPLLLSFLDQRVDPAGLKRDVKGRRERSGQYLTNLAGARRSPGAKLRLLRSAANLDPSNSSIHRMRGAIFREVGDFVEASSAYEAATRVEPGNAWIWRELSEICLLGGRLDEAHRAAMLARSHGHQQPTYDVMLARVLARMGRSDEAEIVLSNVLARAPGDEEALWVLRTIGDTRPTLPRQPETGPAVATL